MPGGGEWQVIVILQTQLMMFIIIAIGYVLTKKGKLSAKTRADITDLVLYVVLPCNIFGSFHKGISPEILRQCGIVLIISTGMQVIYLLLNKFMYIRFSPERRVVAQYATIVNNSGFMGLPVIDAVFGETGLLYGSIVLIPLRVFMWTSGLSLFTSAGLRYKAKALATHPCIWAVILGFVYILVPFELPEFLTYTINVIGNSTTALSMLIVGSILSGVDPRGMLDKDCFYYSFFRLIAIPAFFFGVLVLLRVDPLVTGVSVLSSAMPAATLSVMLSEKYGQDAAFASKMLFVSTVLSLVTLPVIAWALKSLLGISG